MPVLRKKMVKRSQRLQVVHSPRLDGQSRCVLGMMIVVDFYE